MGDLAQILAVPAAGGVGFALWALFRGVAWIREGNRSRDRDVAADRAQWLLDANAAREQAEAELMWWRRWAADLEHVVRTQLGRESLPAQRPYPRGGEGVAGDDR